jgi:hypothetical protein
MDIPVGDYLEGIELMLPEPSSSSSPPPSSNAHSVVTVQSSVRLHRAARRVYPGWTVASPTGSDWPPPGGKANPETMSIARQAGEPGRCGLRLTRCPRFYRCGQTTRCRGLQGQGQAGQE